MATSSRQTLSVLILPDLWAAFPILTLPHTVCLWQQHLCPSLGLHSLGPQPFPECRWPPVPALVPPLPVLPLNSLFHSCGFRDHLELRTPKFPPPISSGPNYAVAGPSPPGCTVDPALPCPLLVSAPGSAQCFPVLPACESTLLAP